VIKEVKTLDDYTVVINLSEPNSILLAEFASQMGFYIWPKHIYEGTDPARNPNNDHPIGTDPFKFPEFVKGSHITLTANPYPTIPLSR
jgi:peptide/nickel transport system substrate-binding protein